MSSISSFHQNPNPNPKFSEPSSSTKSNRRKRNNRNRKKNRKNKKKNIPNWLELPEDVWSLILSKLYTIHLIENVQKVCMLFRKLCKQPSLFKIVDMTLPDAFMHLDFDANILTRFIVDRSCGCLIDIYLEFICDDDTLLYIVDRSRNLKHLRIGHYLNISGEGLIEAVKKLPTLEELEIIICNHITADDIEGIGRACPSLKAFSFNGIGSKTEDFAYNDEALAIAKSMPNLRNLQLIGNYMTNEGLKAILDGCPLLESLDLRACFLIDLSGDLKKRCKQIKRLRRPYDSTADYSHEACDDDSQQLGAYLDSPYSEYDSDDFPGFNPWDLDFKDEYDDYFDDYDDLPLHFLAQFAGAGLIDYDSSD